MGSRRSREIIGPAVTRPVGVLVAGPTGRCRWLPADTVHLVIDGVPQESGERQPGRWVDQEGAPSVPQPTSPPQAGAVYPQPTAPQQAGQPWTGQDHQAAYPAGQPYQYPDSAQPTQQWSPAPGQPAWSAEPSS